MSYGTISCGALSNVLLVEFLLYFMILLFIIYLIAEGLKMRKSKQYRKEIVDMYVSSKTKKLASEEGLDIVKEYDSFKKWLKKQRLERSELDNVIENELSEKIQEPNTSDKKK